MASAHDFDFNNADNSTSFDLIPAGTVVPLIMTIRPGASGEGGWLTKSTSSDAQYLACEFTVTEGKYRNRKFWQNMTVSGGKTDEAGNSKAGNITRSTLRAILESARGIRPDDESDAARKARMVSGYGDFSGMEFVGKAGIEKGDNGYPDRNKLLAVIAIGSADHGKARDNVPRGSSPERMASGDRGNTDQSTVPAWAR